MIHCHDTVVEIAVGGLNFLMRLKLMDGQETWGRSVNVFASLVQTDKSGAI